MGDRFKKNIAGVHAASMPVSRHSISIQGNVSPTAMSTGRSHTIQSNQSAQAGQNQQFLLGVTNKNNRAASDTPMVSVTSSPAFTTSDPSSALTSGTSSPRGIPPLDLPPPRATTLDIPGLTKSTVSPDGNIAARDIGAKLVIVMVGLPARGKSYITKKLLRYLNWQQHGAKIFNVGNTRRKSEHNLGPARQPLPDFTNYDMNTCAVVDTDDEDEEAANKGSSAHPLQNLKNDKSSLENLSPKHSVESAKQPNKEKSESEAAKVEGTSHNADFFSPDNQESSNLREQWAMDTLEHLLDYILEENGSVGIFDATNTTRARRKKVLDRINERSGGRLKVLFLESICTKREIIENNIRLKLSGPDYRNMDEESALQDFRGRLANYERAYETLNEEEEETDENFQYVKMIDVGRKVVCYNIQGFLAGQAVFFLLNFNLAERQIWITRHGESEDNALGRIGGDAPLTERGKKFSKAIGKFIDFQRREFRRKQLEAFSHQAHVKQQRATGSTPASPLSEPEESHFCVWTSMLKRAIETGEVFDEEQYDVKQMRMLNELGAGICDGMTYAEIKEKYPEEYAARVADKLKYRYPGPGGESYLDVINRLRPVIVELERLQDNALIICHRVVARVLLAYFMNLGRDAIGDLDVPLHSLYVLEPKPYGVDWAIYEYNEESDWFYPIPREILRERSQRSRSNSVVKERQYSVMPSAGPRGEILPPRMPRLPE